MQLDSAVIFTFICKSEWVCVEKSANIHLFRNFCPHSWF